MRNFCAKNTLLLTIQFSKGKVMFYRFILQLFDAKKRVSLSIVSVQKSSSYNRNSIFFFVCCCFLNNTTIRDNCWNMTYHLPQLCYYKIRKYFIQAFFLQMKWKITFLHVAVKVCSWCVCVFFLSSKINQHKPIFYRI